VKWCNLLSTNNNLWFTKRRRLRYYIDSLVIEVWTCGCGCHVRYICVSILLYADDILLLAPCASLLQLLLGVCVCEYEKELEYLEMTINTKNHHACVSAQDIMLNAAALQLVIVEKYCGGIH